MFISSFTFTGHLHNRIHELWFSEKVPEQDQGRAQVQERQVLETMVRFQILLLSLPVFVAGLQTGLSTFANFASKQNLLGRIYEQIANAFLFKPGLFSVFKSVRS